MTHPTWTPLQRRLHWFVAAIVLMQFLLQDAMRSATDTATGGGRIGFIDFVVTTVHSWGGALIAFLVIYRLVLRRRSPVVVGHGSLGPLAARFVQANHLLLYALLLMMCVSGVLHYHAGLEFAARWHEVGKWLLALATALHVAGALWHFRRRV